MKKVLVTGANGFIGKNLQVALGRKVDIELKTFDVSDTEETLRAFLNEVDFIYHLAGVNRPEKEEEFKEINLGLTQKVLDLLKEMGRKVPVVITSSIQASLENPYGVSKRAAEDALIHFSEETQTPVYIYRLPNVFGKWCRPNYNSAVATFCYNISHDKEIWISDESKEVELVYIDDVVSEFINLLDRDHAKDLGENYYQIPVTFKVTLGELVRKLKEFKAMRSTSIIPDLSDRFTVALHATYLSYLERDDFSYDLDMKTDQRGWLAELVKSKHFGQIFVSKSHKGILRGNHYHHTKIEKFCVIQGEAVIRFRHILEEDEVISYKVSGDKLEVLDIPPGYTHSIENIGDGEMICLFWANQIFDPENPDTYFCEV